MKTLSHIKLALFTGLILGIVLGIVDMATRIMVAKFEWFNFYQSLVIPIALSIIGFGIVAIFLESIRKVIKLKIVEKRMLSFYPISALFLLLLFYGLVIIEGYLLPDFDIFSPTKLTIISVYTLVIGLIYIILLIKGKKAVFKIISFTQKRKLKNIINNTIFIVLAFIISSFITDIYMLNYTPKTEVNGKLDGYPNILYIAMDSVRADHLSLYGYPLNISPNIDALAENSVVFDNAISPSSWSLPTHSSLFTGRYLYQHNATLIHPKLDNKETTLAEILRAKGYITFGSIGGAFLKASHGFAQGFITYKDRIDFFDFLHPFSKWSITRPLYFLFPLFRDILSLNGKTSEETNKQVFKWLDDNKDKTFFMFIEYHDVHPPYTMGSEFRNEFTNKKRDFNKLRKTLKIKRYAPVPKEDIDYITSLYNAAISYQDYNMGKLFAKLDELGIMNNTIIIILADHGEEFYEHGGFFHGNTLYEEIIHVPLLIHYPKKFKANRIEERIGTIRIFPTILDILQIHIPENVNSKSLLPLIQNGTDNGEEYVLSQMYGRPEFPNERNITSISSLNWKLIEVKEQSDTLPSSLFNLKTDPKEQKNLYDKYPEKRKVLQDIMINMTNYYTIPVEACKSCP